MQESNRKSLLLRMPVLPLRGMMVFPHMVLHFDVGRPKSVAALEKAMMGDQRIFLVAQMDAEIDEPELSDLCRVGTIAQIKQVLNLPGDSIRVLVEGVRRGVLGTVLEEDPCLVATVRLVREDAAPDTAEMKALVRTTHAFFEEYCNASMRVSQETLRSVMDVDKPDQLADIIAANVLTRLEDRQAILEKLIETRLIERVGDRRRKVLLPTAKGKALAVLAERLGIAKEETACIGDGENDLPMFQAAGLKMAMGNGVPELKGKADIILPSNRRSGAAEGIRLCIPR